MVAEIIEQKKDEIAALCRQYGVRALWVFGSVTTNRFDPETSDVDFLVDLGAYTPDYARRFFSLIDELTAVFGRQVDLLTVSSVTNPYLREELDETRLPVYGTPDPQAVA